MNKTGLSLLKLFVENTDKYFNNLSIYFISIYLYIYTYVHISIYLPEADIVEGLVVDAVGFVGVLHQLVHRQGRVVWLHHSVGNLNIIDG